MPYLANSLFGSKTLVPQSNSKISGLFDNQLEFARLDHRQICRLFALEIRPA